VRTSVLRHAYSSLVTLASANDDVGGQYQGERAVYLDSNATTPIDPRVRDEVVRYLDLEFGNAGSRTHLYGQAAKERVNRAREQVAEVVGAKPDEVIFTSGATESNNLALLGLAEHGRRTGRLHLVSTSIEHKAVLEPLDYLHSNGFDLTLVDPTPGGWVDPDEVAAAVRPDTLLVSVMALNNETGVEQPIDEIAERLDGQEVFLHTDAAQSFGKQSQRLGSTRLDLISLSGHKIHAPKGIGALIMRRRGYSRAPLEPLMFGGGQERGLRPGTLPVHLIAGLGAASEIASHEHQRRADACLAFKARLLQAVSPLNPQLNGDERRVAPHTINFSLPGVDSEAAMLSVKDLIAISNGSACTSQRYEPSHVLLAMGYEESRVRGALRMSWSHLTPPVDWQPVVERLKALQRPVL
jgi:cysteine desulfurase